MRRILILVISICLFGCSNSNPKLDVKSTVEKYLTCAYQKDYDCVKKHLDFSSRFKLYSVIHPEILTDLDLQNAAIDQSVKQTCDQVNPKNYDMSLKSIKVTVDPSDNRYATVTYNTVIDQDRRLEAPADP